MNKVHLIQPVHPGTSREERGTITKCSKKLTPGMRVVYGSPNDPETMKQVTCHWCRWGRKS